ncbi:MAG: Holliday junction DNA helicase RuvA [Deltaproteobacteria bacterium RBG_16_71_12]|nr:MAG: Holliday junction DNA helicase RuvA [Deltaproteobacteria bacterium RBG_16_71_12]
MIGWLKGTVRLSDLTSVVVDVGGVGYRVLSPVGDLSRLPAGAAAELFVHTHVREDAIVLYGFLAADGLELFEELLAVSGVGPRTALALLSGMEPADLVRAIAEGDEPRLTKIPGVGKKTAARIVLELRDQLAKQTLGLLGQRARGGPLDDLRSALANLGYRAPQIDRAVQKVRALVDEGQGLSELVREALKHVA